MFATSNTQRIYNEYHKKGYHMPGIHTKKENSIFNKLIDMIKSKYSKKETNIIKPIESNLNPPPSSRYSKNHDKPDNHINPNISPEDWVIINALKSANIIAFQKECENTGYIPNVTNDTKIELSNKEKRKTIKQKEKEEKNALKLATDLEKKNQKLYQNSTKLMQEIFQTNNYSKPKSEKSFSFLSYLKKNYNNLFEKIGYFKDKQSNNNNNIKTKSNKSLTKTQLEAKKYWDKKNNQYKGILQYNSPKKIAQFLESAPSQNRPKLFQNNTNPNLFDKIYESNKTGKESINQSLYDHIQKDNNQINEKQKITDKYKFNVMLNMYKEGYNVNEIMKISNVSIFDQSKVKSYLGVFAYKKTKISSEKLYSDFQNLEKILKRNKLYNPNRGYKLLDTEKDQRDQKQVTPYLPADIIELKAA